MLTTKVCDVLGIEHPVVLAPMAYVSGAALATAVSDAGGLGLIGGGYGDREWLERELAQAAGGRVGCGFITWSLARDSELLDLVLGARPAAVMLSFGNPGHYVEAIRSAGARLILQVTSVEEAREALELSPDVLVAQGGEAGGHGTGGRSTMTLVPELADLLAARHRDTALLAAGGVADGRGLAAALALGADGVLVGSWFVMSSEALVSPRVQQRVAGATGDRTIRTRVLDIARDKDWADGYTGRVLRNRFVDDWHGREAGLAADLPGHRQRYADAVSAEDFDTAGLYIGEAIGLMDGVRPAAQIVADMVSTAAEILRR